MKSRILTILSVFILSITFLMCNSNNTGQGPEETTCEPMQTVAQIMPFITLGKTVERYVIIDGKKIDKVEEVAKKIRSDYLNLCKHFENGDFKGMADILGKKASLKTKDGQYIRGKKPIRKYFEEIRTDEGDEYQRVDFELVWAVIVHEERKPFLGKVTDNMIHENFVYHLIEEQGGEILRNQDGDGERSGRHTQGCTWIGN